MKQNIGNACGTIGVLHAIANNQDVLDFGTNLSPEAFLCGHLSSTDDGYLKTFLAKTKDMSAEKRAEYLETDEVRKIRTHNCKCTYMICRASATRTKLALRKAKRRHLSATNRSTCTSSLSYTKMVTSMSWVMSELRRHDPLFFILFSSFRWNEVVSY